MNDQEDINIGKLNESEACYKALLDAGFVYDQTNKKFFFHNVKGELVWTIKRPDSHRFDNVVRNLGDAIFTSAHPMHLRREVANIQQSIFMSCAQWEEAIEREMESYLKSL